MRNPAVHVARPGSAPALALRHAMQTCVFPSSRTATVVFSTVLFSTVLLVTGAGIAGAQPATPAASSSLSLFPKPGAPDPAPFTLLDRYFDAARRADLRMLKLCVEKGVDTKAKDEVGRSALLMAVRDGRSLELLSYLHGIGLDVDEPDARGRTALADAASLGEFKLVDYLIEQGAEVNHKDEQGQSPLYNAVLGGDLETVKRLLEAGAEVNTQDRYGDTPLMGACNKGHEEIARLLFEKGADPSLTDQEGRTAAQRASEDSAFCRNLGEAPPPSEIAVEPDATLGTTDSGEPAGKVPAGP